MPDIFNGKILLMFHGFTGNKTEHGGIFRDFSRLLELNNVASLRMDFSGNGESDGDFTDFTFTTMVNEAYLLLDYVKKIKDVKEIILLGFSMGGALASYIAGQRSKDIDKLILWSPAANIINLIKTRYEISNKFPNGNTDTGSFSLSKKMYESLDNYNVLDGVENFEKPVLIIHGKKDLAVNYQISIDYEKKYKNATLHIIETAGHGYDRSAEKEELLNKSAMFLRG